MGCLVMVLADGSDVKLRNRLARSLQMLDEGILSLGTT
jgi:hypothetical protein